MAPRWLLWNLCRYCTYTLYYFLPAREPIRANLLGRGPLARHSLTRGVEFVPIAGEHAFFDATLTSYAYEMVFESGIVALSPPSILVPMYKALGFAFYVV